MSVGEDEDEEEEDEFAGNETLITPRPGQRDPDFSDQDTLVIREGQPGVSLRGFPKQRGPTWSSLRGFPKQRGPTWSSLRGFPKQRANVGRV